MSVVLSRIALSLAPVSKSPRQRVISKQREEGEKSSGERLSEVLERVREVGGERERGGEREKEKVGGGGENEKKEEKRGGEKRGGERGRERETCVIS